MEIIKLFYAFGCHVSSATRLLDLNLAVVRCSFATCLAAYCPCQRSGGKSGLQAYALSCRTCLVARLGGLACKHMR